jgi:hypothetical protein
MGGCLGRSPRCRRPAENDLVASRAETSREVVDVPPNAAVCRLINEQDPSHVRFVQTGTGAVMGACRGASGGL